MKKKLETKRFIYGYTYQELVQEKEKTDKKIRDLEYRNVHLETTNKALEETFAVLENREKKKHRNSWGGKSMRKKSWNIH
ncbi:unnamed protein product [Arctia plantaginis]|uniref:Uncharacterized protein n=1 Tax=Arctia plantaginis TaxID=874455 RepID=A0A8S1A9I5_ARCPL|nr:unnamed protein product [Arctia plantaginis]